MTKSEKEMVDEIMREYNSNKNVLVEIQKLFNFAFGDQWRDKHGNPIEIKGLPKRVHNKIVPYLRTLTSYFIESFPEVKILSDFSNSKLVEREINRIISAPENQREIAKAVGLSLVAGFSVVRFDIFTSKVRIKNINPYLFYPEGGNLDLDNCSFVVEKYIAKKDTPLIAIDLPQIYQSQYNWNKEKFASFTRIYLKQKNKMKIIVLASENSDVLSFGQDVVFESEIDNLIFPYSVITTDTFINTIYDYINSEVSQARDTQIMINKLISYSDIVMGLSALGIVKVRNLQPNSVEIYPGVVIPLPEFSDIAIDRGIGLNFNFEGYNLSSTLIDDIFGMSEILRGVKPGSITSGAGLSQMYSIALARLQIKVPAIKLFFKKLVSYILSVLPILTEKGIVNLDKVIALDIAKMLEGKNVENIIDISPVFTTLRRDEEIVDTVIRFVNSGVFPPQEAYKIIQNKYKYLFLTKEEMLKTKINEMFLVKAGEVIEKLISNMSLLENVFIGGVNMPIGQPSNNNQVALSDAEKKFLEAVGIDPSDITPEVIRMANDMIQDPELVPTIQQMYQEFTSKGYSDRDAKAMILVLIIKSILDAIKQETPQSQQPQQ